MTLHAVQDGVRDEPWSDVVIRLEHEADQHTAKADQCRWQAARIISERLALGETQRAVALAIGKSPMHVNYMNRVWADSVNLGVQDGSSFNDAYQAAKAPKVPAGAGPSEDKPERRPEDRPRAPLPDSDPDVVERNQVADLAEILEKTLDKLEALVQSGSQQTREFITTELEMHVVSVTRTLQRSKA